MRDVVERECARFGVPGAAVTVVADGEVVLADGFGRRDATRPVTPSTLFMLASDTKCFAAATLCLLVEDGVLDLDRPVRDYLPWFAMHDDRVSGLVTSRDLLAHRTGLPRHELMTVGNGDFAITNEDIARRMRHLEASRPFRQGFGYNNAHYATAGHVVEALTGQPWRQVLAERILDPLKMTGSSTYTPELALGDFAAPHVGSTQLPFQTRAYDLPSGGIVTNADDLGRWLLARLGRGGLSPEVLGMLHAPVVASAEALPFPEIDPMGYALGNLVASYRGQRMHLHGGSQIGFGSQVIVLPDAQLGVAVMTNTHGSLLPLALGLALVDQLLGDEQVGWGERLSVAPPAQHAPPVDPGQPSRPSVEYAGTYQHPAYGDVVVEARDGGLQVAFHGLDDQLVLTHVDQDDWRLVYLTLPGFSFPASFRRGPDGKVVDLTLGIEPELPPIAFLRR